MNVSVVNTQTELDALKGYIQSQWSDMIFRGEFTEQRRVGEGIVFVARDERGSDTPLGVMIMHSYLSQPESYIQILYVDKRYRRRGIGKLLVDAGKSMATSLGNRRICCYATVDKREVASFWLSSGFLPSITESGVDGDGVYRRHLLEKREAYAKALKAGSTSKSRSTSAGHEGPLSTDLHYRAWREEAEINDYLLDMEYVLGPKGSIVDS